MKKKRKPIKAWAVFWEKKSAKDYGVNPNNILPLEPIEKFKIRCRCHRKKGRKTGWHYGDGLAIFSTLAEARGWVENNKDWLIVPVKIVFS